MPAPPRDAPVEVVAIYRSLLDLFLPWDSAGWEVDRVLGAYHYTTGIATDERSDYVWRAELVEAVEAWVATGDGQATTFVERITDDQLWPLGLKPPPPPAQLPLPRVG